MILPAVIDNEDRHVVLIFVNIAQLVFYLRNIDKNEIRSHFHKVFNDLLDIAVFTFGQFRVGSLNVVGGILRKLDQAIFDFKFPQVYAKTLSYLKLFRLDVVLEFVFYCGPLAVYSGDCGFELGWGSGCKCC